DARRRSPVAVTLLVAERAVALVDDDDHLTERLHDRQDLLEVALGRADPLAAEVLELDRREPGFFDERFGHEGFARPHRTGEKDSHGAPVAPSLANVFRDELKLLLRLLDAAHDGEIVPRLDEFDEPEALPLDDLALALEDELEDAALVLARRLGREQRLDLHDLETGGDLGELVEP